MNRSISCKVLELGGEGGGELGAVPLLAHRVGDFEEGGDGADRGHVAAFEGDDGTAHLGVLPDGHEDEVARETDLTTAVRGRKATPSLCSTIRLAASMLSTSMVLSSLMPGVPEQRVRLLEVAGVVVEEDELLVPDLRQTRRPPAW